MPRPAAAPARGGLATGAVREDPERAERRRGDGGVRRVVGVRQRGA